MSIHSWGNGKASNGMSPTTVVILLRWFAKKYDWRYRIELQLLLYDPIKLAAAFLPPAHRDLLSLSGIPVTPPSCVCCCVSKMNYKTRTGTKLPPPRTYQIIQRGRGKWMELLKNIIRIFLGANGKIQFNEPRRKYLLKKLKDVISGGFKTSFLINLLIHFPQVFFSPPTGRFFPLNKFKPSNIFSFARTCYRPTRMSITSDKCVTLGMDFFSPGLIIF